MVYRFVLFLSRWPAHNKQDAQLSQRDRIALVLAKNGSVDNTLRTSQVCPQLL